MLMAVPKKGRLYDQCIRMLERAGIKVVIRIDIFTNLLTHVERFISISAERQLIFTGRKSVLN